MIEGFLQKQTGEKQKLIDILKKEGNLKIIPSEFSVKVPESFDSELENIIGDKLLHTMASTIVRYLRAPVVIDKFGTDHDNRRIWEKQMVEKYGKPAFYLLANNKLAKNKFSNVVAHLSTIERFSKIKLYNHPKIIKLRECETKLNQIVGSYRSLSVENRIKITEEISDIFLNILNIIGKAPSSS